jgi:hypothetical protein
MSIMELGALGEFIGSIGVVASLIYLAIQIRQNSISNKAQAVQSTSDRMIDISLAMATDGSWPDLFNRAGDDFESLTPSDRGRAGWMWFAIMRGQETLYHHYLEGNVDDQTWETYATAIRHNAKMPGFRQWWRSISGTYTFAQDFDEFVSQAADQAEASGEKYEWFGGETVP